MTLVHCSRVGQKIGSATVSHAVDVVSVPLVFTKMCLYVIESIADIRELVEHHTVRDEAVFNAEHQITECAKLGAEETVKLLIADDKSATMDIYDNREDGIFTAIRTVDVHLVCFHAIIHVWDIMFYRYTRRH